MPPLEVSWSRTCQFSRYSPRAAITIATEANRYAFIALLSRTRYCLNNFSYLLTAGLMHGLACNERRACSYVFFHGNGPVSS